MTTSIISNEEANKIVEELQATKKMTVEIKKVEEKLKQKLYNYMGEHDELINYETGEPFVKWTYSEGYMKFDAKKFMEEKPQLYKKYLVKTNDVRTLRITK